MKLGIASAIALAAAALLSGCSSDFDREALAENLKVDKTKADDNSIRRTVNVRPLARKPFKLAVVFPSATWSREDREQVLKALETLKKDGTVSEIIPVADSMVPAGDASLLRKARYAAAKYQSDVLLIVREAPQKNQYVNGLAFFDITIAGALLFPGSQCDALDMVECSFWDVRNECLMGTVSAEGQGATVRPTFLMDSARALKEARAKAAKDAAIQLENRAPLIFRDLPKGTAGEMPEIVDPASEQQEEAPAKAKDAAPQGSGRETRT